MLAVILLPDLHLEGSSLYYMIGSGLLVVLLTATLFVTPWLYPHYGLKSDSSRLRLWLAERRDELVVWLVFAIAGVVITWLPVLTSAGPT